METTTTDSRPTHDTLRVILASIAAAPGELQQILTTSQHALLVLSSNRQITAANAAVEQLFGYEAGALVGQMSDRLLPARMRQPDAPPMVPLADIMQVELPGIRRDESEFRVEWVLGSVRVEDHEVFVAVVRDRDQIDRALDALRSSEERFRFLVDGVRDYAIFMLDANGVISSWNTGAQRIKGYTANEIIGQHYEKFFTEDDRAAQVPHRLLARAALDGVHEVEGWRVRKNGERFRASAYLAALRSSTGELYGYAKVTRDLTDKDQTQELEHRLEVEQAARAAAEEAESRLRRVQAISAALSVAVTPHDIAKAILDQSLPALQAIGGALFGLEDGQFALIDQIGHPETFFAKHTRVSLTSATAMADAARQKLPLFFGDREQLSAAYPEYREIYASGVFHAVASLPLFAHGQLVGNLTVYFATPREFTPSERSILTTISEVCAQALERAQLFLAESKARELAEAANRSKDQFLAILGHELRNPLAPIVTALKLLPEDSGRARDAIDRNVKHLVRLVDDLLDVSRITEQKVQLHKQRVELIEIVDRAVELTGPLVDERKHHLAVDVPSGLVVFGDSTRLAQVVANLINNAAKYTDRGGHINVSAREHAGVIELVVRDDGGGIDAAMLPHVFELFMQEQQSLERSQGGLGLGLAIVRSIVTMHGGTVTAASDGHGKGSTFTVVFPITDQVAAVPVEPSRPARTQEASKRILVVDDNTDAAELMAELFERSGHRTAVAFDGPSALEIAATFAPEIAVLDIGLPVMDGYELARRLREQIAKIHLIALTGYGQSSDRARALDAGFDVHLVKPVDPTALRAAVLKSS